MSMKFCTNQECETIYCDSDTCPDCGHDAVDDNAGEVPIPITPPVPVPVPEKPEPIRRHLNKERPSITHKFSVAGHKGYVTVGMFEDGQPGELFIRMSKQGSTMSGMADSFATMTSLALQYGVPVKQLCRKFVGVRYEPQGHTPNPDIPNALSITDYIFRWLAFKFLTEEERVEIGMPTSPTTNEVTT